MPSDPLAYFITFTTYGTWLRGRDPGSVDRDHNSFDTPFLPDDPRTESGQRVRMTQPPYTLDAVRRDIVLNAVREVCAYRGWVLLAAHVRTNHLHVVVSAPDILPERAMNDFKTYASRSLNAAGIDPPDRKRWTRHGSTRYLWTEAEVEGAMCYVVEGQGDVMALFDSRVSNNAP